MTAMNLTNFQSETLASWSVNRSVWNVDMFHMHAVSVWLSQFVTGIFLGLLAMVLHECGHLIAALILGVKVSRVGLKWNKGMYVVRDRGTVHQNMLIALAGPLVNLLLVALQPWYPMFALANACCVLANVLPIEGTDGYRVAGCWREMKDGELAS